MGAWRFMQDNLEPLLEPTKRVLHYAGRAESASPASGSLKRHQQEQAELVGTALSAAFEVGLAAPQLVR